MTKTAALIAFSTIVIGLGVPALCLYSSVYYGFSYVAAGITAIGALIIAGSIGIVGIVLGPLGQLSEGPSASERQKLSMMRAHQRATLEELDDLVSILEEIRDLLRAVEE